MSCLVITELEDDLINRSSLATIKAASQIDKDIDIIVLNRSSCDKAKNIKNIKNVIFIDSKIENMCAENLSNMLVGISKNYSHILAPSGTFSKDIMPRLSALLDTQQISDIIKVIDADTYQRPIYAGNAIATVKSLDEKKVITVRSTAFVAEDVEGGDAKVIEAPKLKTDDPTVYIEEVWVIGVLPYSTPP